MTAAELLEAVTAITMPDDHPVATGDEIKEWCTLNGIDWESSLGGDFHKADHANAPIPLRKFKLEPVARNGPNAWCLVSRWAAACAWCASQTPQWRAIPWNGANWIWQQSARVTSATVLATFDQETMAT